MRAIYSQNGYKTHCKNKQHKRMTIGCANVRRAYRARYRRQALKRAHGSKSRIIKFIIVIDHEIALHPHYLLIMWYFTSTILCCWYGLC